MAGIKFKGFVERLVTDRDGVTFGLVVAEPHRRKNDAGEWETTARTFRTVKASRQAGVDWSVFAQRDRVEVAGQEKTEHRNSADGKDHYDLVVWVDSITRDAGTGRTVAEEPFDQWVTTDTPF